MLPDPVFGEMSQHSPITGMHFILLSTLQLCTRPPPLLLFALHLIDFLVKLQLTIVYFGSYCHWELE